MMMMIIPTHPFLVKKTIANYDHTNVIIDMYGNISKIDKNGDINHPLQWFDDDKHMTIQATQQQK